MPSDKTGCLALVMTYFVINSYKHVLVHHPLYFRYYDYFLLFMSMNKKYLISNKSLTRHKYLLLSNKDVLSTRKL